MRSKSPETSNRRETSNRKLTLDRETLRRLEDGELGGVAGGAPTRGAVCSFSDPSACATCLCTV